MSFRYDINGLRAIAVIAVVLFHFNPAWVPGGFAGVDVFFVISGFLMTGIIYRGIEQENFSILQFYIARANRIIPALAVLCLVLLVFGWFYLHLIDYRALGKHVAASMGFLSNIIYSRESGYFDAASHEKWLLHTWSLSVEWQFYIIYPLVLVAMRKFISLNALKTTVLIGVVLSFILCVIASHKWPNLAYYLLPARAWEMMIGGIAYFYPLKFTENKKKTIECVGLALIALSYIFISKENLWPGYLALIPVLGAFLLIQAQRNNSIITGNIVFQSLGKWSYSIYLWHWPVIVFGNYFEVENWYLYGLPASIFLGFVSFNFVERIKFNTYSMWSDTFKVKPFYIAMTIAAVATFTFLTDGIPLRYGAKSEEIKIASAESTNSNPHQEKCLTFEGLDFKKCKFGSGDVSLILIGDSHSSSVLTAVIDALPSNKGLLYLGYSGCPIVKNAQRIKQARTENHFCKEYNSWLHDEIHQYNRNIPVLIVNRMTHYVWGLLEHENQYKSPPLSSVITFSEDKESIVVGVPDNIVSEFEHEFTETIGYLTKNDRKVFYVMPIPEMDFIVPKEEINRIIKAKAKDNVKISISDYNNRHRHLMKIINSIKDSNDNFILLNPLPYLCGDTYCYGSDENHRPFYYDDDHLSEYGNRRLIPMFKSITKAL